MTQDEGSMTRAEGSMAQARGLSARQGERRAESPPLHHKLTRGAHFCDFGTVTRTFCVAEFVPSLQVMVIV